MRFEMPCFLGRLNLSGVNTSIARECLLGGRSQASRDMGSRLFFRTSASAREVLQLRVAQSFEVRDNEEQALTS